MDTILFLGNGLYINIANVLSVKKDSTSATITFVGNQAIVITNDLQLENLGFFLAAKN